MAIGKKTGGKDFVKRDPRINRNGRPKKITATTLKEVLALWKSGEITDKMCVKKIYDMALDGDFKVIKWIFDHSE